MTSATLPTPAQLGYRFPAEWEPHAGTWLSWPHKEATWPGKFEPIPAVWAGLARTLAKYEPVHVLCGGAARSVAASLLADAANVHRHDDVPTNDVWARDHGPCFLVADRGRSLPPALVDWRYNAWGGKYPPYDLDDAVPAAVARLLGQQRFEPGIVMEGGAIEVNGAGLLLTTEECLLNPNRNPGLSKAEIERFLCDYLGVRKVLWLGQGSIAGDDTDGHIDELARFVDARTVLIGVEEDPTDENYDALQEHLARLRTLTDEEGRPLQIVTLPMPRPLYFEDNRLPASYMNFYVANGAVIVPAFDDPADAIAADVLGRLFPGRTIELLPAVDLVWGLGGYHCVTQQQPVQ